MDTTGLRYYSMSADGGNTWTDQWLTPEEVVDAVNCGLILSKKEAKTTNRFVPTLEQRDRYLEDLWKELGDVPMNPETETIEEPFQSFPAGTSREEIWHWFDERHSKGVPYLLYGYEAKDSHETDVKNIISEIASCLPHTPDYRLWAPENRIWSNDFDEILCETEQLSESIADLLDAMYGYPTVNTGYYDPEDDKRNGETDDRTGFYYVTVS